MDYKQKYKQALERAKFLKENTDSVGAKDVSRCFEEIFPELKKTEDEKMRNFIGHELICLRATDEKGSDRYEELTNAFNWLEKQGKQEQLYIRFGEIPTDEKSKIYQGKVEVGTENGVSVYPAFKTKEGDIVLGLNLPITKTTLYTTQHLLEYDNRPCYLVKGDYVGKDSDGQPLINNISIIEKIDNYRVKEEKQDEQKEINLVEILKHYPKETELYSPLYGKLWLAEVDEEHEIITCYKHCLDKGCTRAILEQEDTVSFYSNGTTGLPDCNVSKDCMLFLYDIEKQGGQANKIEPKFKVGDWIVRNYQNNGKVVNRVTNVEQLDDETYGYDLDDGTYFSGYFEEDYHL